MDSFYQVIPFGTGGRRGLVGVGPNRINTWTIQASAQGHCQYLIRHFGNEAQRRGVVLTFDVRKYTQKGIYDETLANPVMNLDGRRLARAAAAVYAANGIKVYMFQNERSTPELSYAIRYLNAVSGDMFSASHNLPTDNGKKVYEERIVNFKGHYKKEIDISSYGSGTYFLEIIQGKKASYRKIILD